jgi:hypothetical protein
MSSIRPRARDLDLCATGNIPAHRACVGFYGADKLFPTSQVPPSFFTLIAPKAPVVLL